MRRLLLLFALSSTLTLGNTGAFGQAFSSLEEVEQYRDSISLNQNQLMFIVRSLYPYIVDLEFYSDTRRNVAWPGGNEVYVLKNNNWNVFILNCKRCENICYGAGARGRNDLYWGVGVNFNSSCSECCYRCTGTTSRAITLE